MAGQATFMVTDELLVKPLSSISCLSLLNQFNLPLSDLEERFVSMGEEEVKEQTFQLSYYMVWCVRQSLELS